MECLRFGKPPISPGCLATCQRTMILAALGMTIAIAGGCGPYEPIVDRGRADFNEAAYQHDLAQCRGYAQQIEAGEQAVAGGVLGAAAGAAFGAIGGAFGGGAGSGAGLGASVGGLAGALGGGLDASERQVQVVQRCLAGRGYAVLD